MLIDTHAHLYSRKFDADRAEMVQRAIDAGIERVYLPNIDAESIERMLALEADFPENCFAMMGLHPCSVQPATWEQELATVEHWLGQRTWAGIGETGVDLHWDVSTLAIQQRAFARQVEWAKGLGKARHYPRPQGQPGMLASGSSGAGWAAAGHFSLLFRYVGRSAGND